MTKPTTFAGEPALQSGNVLVLFKKVATTPPQAPQSALWHVGWHVVNVRERPDVQSAGVKFCRFMPLMTVDRR